MNTDFRTLCLKPRTRLTENLTDALLIFMSFRPHFSSRPHLLALRELRFLSKQISRLIR
jgi:hypothetical protein